MADSLPRVLTASSAGNQKVTSSDQCDCACAHFSCKGSAALITGPLEAINEAHEFSLPGGWQGMFIPNGQFSLAVLNTEAYQLWKRFENPQFPDNVSRNEYETRVLEEMAAIGLLRFPDEPIRQAISPRSQLSAWLHVTDRCNLRCAYCYLPHTREDMSFEMGKAVVDASFRSATLHNYSQVNIKYAGGEPLLRFPLVLDLHHYARELAAGTGLDLDGVVLSNGTLLTKTMVTCMRELDLRLMISLDGIDEWHNAQRPYMGGRGSFADVTSGVLLAKEHGLTPHISITVSGRNAAGLPEIVAWALENRLPFSLNFYRQNDFSMKYTDLRLEEEKIIAGMMAAFEVIEENLPGYSLLGSLVDRASLVAPHVRTCAVGQDYLVFDPRGSVSRCHMRMQEPVTDVYAVDPLGQIRTDMISFQNLPVDEKDGCRNCLWKFWCAGGCPLETYRATGRYDLQSPNCAIYQALLPAILRLEALRLLQQQTASGSA